MVGGWKMTDKQTIHDYVRLTWTDDAGNRIQREKSVYTLEESDGTKTRLVAGSFPAAAREAARIITSRPPSRNGSATAAAIDALRQAREDGVPGTAMPPTLDLIRANVDMGRALVDALTRVAELEDLVRHCWVHSGHRDCGYEQMARNERALFCQVIGRTEGPNYEPPEDP